MVGTLSARRSRYVAKTEDLPETLALAFERIRALHATLAAIIIDSTVLRRLVVKTSKRQGSIPRSRTVGICIRT
jgi:hypothetical protein